jgi:hypothetical protein
MGINYTLIVAAISVAATLQRLLREDVKWFPTLVAPYRGLVIAALQIVITPVLDAALNGAGVVPALITGLISVIPTVLNVVASLTADKAASKLGPVAGAAALVLCLGAAPGCAAFRGAMADVKDFAQTVDTFEKDAAAKISALHSEVSAALAILPDVPPELKAGIEKGFSDVETALAAAIAATANIESLTDESALVSVFGGFVKAWDLLQTLVQPVLGKASTKLGASPHIEPRIVAISHRRAAAK